MGKQAHISRSLTLNCDLGESYGAWQLGCDADVMPLIDSANISPVAIMRGTPRLFGALSRTRKETPG